MYSLNIIHKVGYMSQEKIVVNVRLPKVIEASIIKLYQSVKGIKYHTLIFY